MSSTVARLGGAQVRGPVRPRSRDVHKVQFGRGAVRTGASVCKVGEFRNTALCDWLPVDAIAANAKSLTSVIASAGAADDAEVAMEVAGGSAIPWGFVFPDASAKLIAADRLPLVRPTDELY